MSIAELSMIKIQRTKTSRISELDYNNMPFGKVFSDHMVVVDYANGEWQTPQIMPYSNLSLSPACSSLHYGQLIFEGMKAFYEEASGKIILFRPEDNARRLNESAKRMAMPELPVAIFMECLEELIKLDRAWVPKTPDSSLYIRPFMMANDPFIGVNAASNFKFIIFTCPVGPYYSKPLNVLISDQFVRAVRGGIGAAKTAGNYAATLYPAQLAKKQGYDQILWTDGLERKYVEECGTMNTMFVIDNKIVTAETEEGTILQGITRDSVLKLCKYHNIPFEERKVSIEELLNAHKNGTLTDAFGVGTAAVIIHFELLGYKGTNYTLPPVETRTISTFLKKQLVEIQRGKTESPYNWVIKL